MSVPNGKFKEREPHKLLAKMMSEQLGVHVDPYALRLFVNAYWDRVSALTHAMHDAKEDAGSVDMGVNAKPQREFGVPS